MEQADLLRHLAEAFESLRVPYIVTGSTATIAYGEPRFTNDIDVVVALAPSQIQGLLAAFPSPEFYVSRPAVEAAVARKHQFNIIHPSSGLKIDVIISSDSEFDRQRLVRARQLPVLADRAVSFASPEDVILKKLEYFREGGSDKHLRDIAGVLQIQRERVDHEYISKWVKRLRLEVEWALVLSRVANSENASDGNSTT